MESIYEWTWAREGHPDHSTRSTRNAASLKRFAAKHGGAVKRRKVGYKIPGKIMDELNELAHKELD